MSIRFAETFKKIGLGDTTTTDERRAFQRDLDEAVRILTFVPDYALVVRDLNRLSADNFRALVEREKEFGTKRARTSSL